MASLGFPEISGSGEARECRSALCRQVSERAHRTVAVRWARIPVRACRTSEAVPPHVARPAAARAVVSGSGNNRTCGPSGRRHGAGRPHSGRPRVRCVATCGRPVMRSSPLRSSACAVLATCAPRHGAAVGMVRASPRCGGQVLRTPTRRHVRTKTVGHSAGERTPGAVLANPVLPQCGPSAVRRRQSGHDRTHPLRATVLHHPQPGSPQSGRPHVRPPTALPSTHAVLTTPVLRMCGPGHPGPPHVRPWSFRLPAGYGPGHSGHPQGADAPSAAVRMLRWTGMRWERTGSVRSCGTPADMRTSGVRWSASCGLPRIISSLGFDPVSFRLQDQLHHH